MKSRFLVSVLALSFAFAFGTRAFAHDGDKHDTADKAATASGKLVKVSDKAADWFAKAKAAYPMNVCVVSDDTLGGDMGLPQDYIYRVAGKPDRLVRFCCNDCVKDFNADPAKFLGMIDAAAEKKTAK